MNSNVVLPCGRLRVVFRRLADRIGHRIEVRESDIWTAVLESVEGNETDIWPSSPALQTLHVESRPAGQVALLVGMAGRSHWSAGVAADTVQGRATFDVACRISDASDWLGSTYRWLVAGEHAVRQDIQVAPASAILVSSDEPLLVIRSATGQEPSPRTIRWSYSIQTEGIRIDTSPR